MKQHPTIPAVPRNLQRAEGKCNLQLATRRRRTLWRTPHFQLSIFNFQLLLALALIACSDETVDQPDTPHLAANERLVEIALPGLSSGGSTAANAATDISRADIDNIASAGENVIKQLTVLCFVNLTASGTDAAKLDDYTLEREYTYASGGDANDITLVADADGYRAAIGVPKDDTRRRTFLLKANQIAAGSVTNTAVPVSGADRTSATTYAAALNETSATLPSNTNLTCPLLMSVRVTRTVITGAGEYIDDPVFTQEDLAKGISARMIRRVTRIDISNPVTTGFTVTGIKAAGNPSVPLFIDDFSGYMQQDYPEITLSNAAGIPAAIYLYPVSGDSDNAEITLSGTYAGNPVTLGITTKILPNTRYTIAVRNDGSNLRLDITVAPWNDGGTIDTPDIAGTLNSEHHLATTSTLYTGQIPHGDSTTINGNRITYATTDLFTSGGGFLEIRGKQGDSNPVGIIIPDDCTWIYIADKQTDADNTYTCLLGLYAPDDIAPASRAIGRPQTNYLKRPREAVITIVTRDGGGYNKYTEYTVYQEYYNPTHAAAAFIINIQPFAALASVDNANRVIHLPPLPYINLEFLPDNNISFAFPQTYPEEDYPWIDINNNGLNVPYLMYTTNSGNNGEERTAYLRVRTRKNGDPASPVVTNRWTVIQDAMPNDALLATGHTLQLRLLPEKELRLEGDTIYMNHGNYHSEYYNIYLQYLANPDNEALKKRLEHALNSYLDNLDIEDNNTCLSVVGTNGIPAFVTSNDDWVRVTYTSDDQIIVFPQAYLPPAIDQKIPDRIGSFTVHMQGGKTKTYYMKQTQTKITE